MWLLLEYDRHKHDQALEMCQQAGIMCEGILREDQLASVDLAQVDLLLVGDRWKEQTVTQLREGGLSASVVLIADSAEGEVRALATDLGCVEMVSYPLPITYLRSWASTPSPEAIQTVDTAEDRNTYSPMEELLRTKPRRSLKRSDWGSRSESLSASTGDAAALRGRILLLYGLRGGIGKTTMTTLLAHHLAMRMCSVAVIELDPKGNLQERLQIQSPITVDEWAKMPSAMDERMVRQALVKPRAAGFSFLPRGEHTRDVEAATVRRILIHMASYFDIVLVDASTDDELESTRIAREMAHRVLYIMTPEWNSFRSFVQGYEQMRRQKGEEAVTVIVNRFKRSGEHQKALRLLQEVKIPQLIRVPEDRMLWMQAAKGQPLSGGREVKRAMAQIPRLLSLDPVRTAARHQKRWFQ